MKLLQRLNGSSTAALAPSSARVRSALCSRGARRQAAKRQSDAKRDWRVRPSGDSCKAQRPYGVTRKRRTKVGWLDFAPSVLSCGKQPGSVSTAAKRHKSRKNPCWPGARSWPRCRPRAPRAFPPRSWLTPRWSFDHPDQGLGRSLDLPERSSIPLPDRRRPLARQRYLMRTQASRMRQRPDGSGG